MLDTAPLEVQGWTCKGVVSKAGYVFMYGCVKYMFIVCVVFIYIYVRVRGSRYLRQPWFGTCPAAGLLASHMRPYERICAHMGPPGPIWSEYEPIWAQMGPYEDHWAHMGPYGPIWAHMGPCGPMGWLKNVWLC